MTLELSVSFCKVIIQTQRKKERKKEKREEKRERAKNKKGKDDEASKCSIFLMNVCLETFFFKKKEGLKELWSLN